MKILLSNDDGIYSEGLLELALALKDLGEIYIVAPDRERSATGHAITIHQPLRCKKVTLCDRDLNAWWVSGTPSDCIKLGIESIIGVKPDLVVSGINKGENLGTDILYSGTVSAAIEGAIFGVPSIAFSYANYESEDFATPATIARKIVDIVINNKIPSGIILNVNIPSCNKKNIKGVKVTRLGVRKYKNNFEQRKDPRGKIYFWLAGELIDEGIGEDTDIFAIKNNYVSITPVHIDLTYYKLMDELRNWDIEL